MIRRNRVAVAIVLMLFLCGAGPADQPALGHATASTRGSNVVYLPLVQGASRLDVPLVVQETAGVARVNDPVTFGIPLPRTANITTTAALLVALGSAGASGQAVPAQFTVLARWAGAPDDATRPIKWVLVDFQATLAASASITYTLRTGGNAPVHPTPIHLAQDASTITVDTGPARLVIAKTGFDLIHQVYLDRDGDGQVDDPLLVERADAGPIVAANGSTYRANLGALESVVVESSGPLHAIVRVKGWHTNAGGQKLLAFTARLHFYAGQSAARVCYGVWNDNLMVNYGGQPDVKAFGSPNTILFSDLSLHLQLSATAPLTYTLGGLPGQSWSGPLTLAASVYQDSSGGPQWHHDPDNLASAFRGFRVTANGTELRAACSESASSEECRALGWAGLAAANGGLAVGVRHFWQNYPKSLDLSADGTASIGLFPDACGADFELRVGEQKMHEVLYYFHAGDAPAAVAARLAALHDPLRPWASASWYVQQAGVFDQSVPYDAAHFPDYEGYNDAAILYPQANFLLLHDGLVGTGWYYADRPEQWGWRNAGDTVAEDECGGDDWPVFTNQQYDHPFFFLYQAVRTLDAGGGRAARWWPLAELGARHQADVDIVHSRCTGQSEDQMLTCMDTVQGPPYPVGWAMGGRLTNQHHADPSPDVHRHGLIDTWSGGIRGMVYYWYLTGDGFAADGWRELAENVRWRVENTPCNADPDASCGPGYAGSRPGTDDDMREGAYNLEILADAFDATGDTRYRDAARLVVQAIDPTDTWFTAPTFHLDATAAQEGRTVSPWVFDLLSKSLGHYLDTYQLWYGTVDPTARDVLLSYADLLTRWWQLGEAEPTQYRVYETGGYIADYGFPTNVALADGLAWALDYDDGRLDQARTKQVAAEAFAHGSTPWGDYARNTFMTAKTHAMMGVHGWRYLRYAREQP